VRIITISLHPHGSIQLRSPTYDLRLNDEGRVVLVVGKTEHETNFTDVERLRTAIEGKRAPPDKEG